MRVDKIEIKGFRVFEDVTFELGKHLTCIAGHNGVGKSTLLAILSNIGELKKSEGTHLNGNAFKGEFSQVIHGDEEHDDTGEKCTIYFSDLPTSHNPDNPYVKKLSFRTTFQQKTVKKEHKRNVNAIIDGKEEEVTIVESTVVKSKNKRYRFLPIKTKERNTESKLTWPTYYLGLTRLYPIGESEEIKVETEKSIPEDINQKILTKHANILGSSHEYLESSSIVVSDTNKKKGFGVKTDDFSEKMNSAGQDNLGQILTTVYSFEQLKESQGEKYNGGLLLIDEIDATLHPVAQNRLIDFLYEKSVELDLQIVFTTHSISLLEHIARKQNKHVSRKDFQSLYLTNKRGKLEPKKNPDFISIKSDLMDTYIGADSSKTVPILTEDDTTRWFLKLLFKAYREKCDFQVSYVEMSVGWNQLIKLIKHDYIHYQNYLVFLDPDINQENLRTDLNHAIKGTPYKINKNNNNIFILPGDKYIEKIMWDFLKKLDAGHQIYFEPVLESRNLTRSGLISQGPESDVYKSYKTEKEKIKKWFENHKWLCEIAFKYWIKSDEIHQEVIDFMSNLISAYNKIYHRL